MDTEREMYEEKNEHIKICSRNYKKKVKGRFRQGTFGILCHIFISLFVVHHYAIIIHVYTKIFGQSEHLHCKGTPTVLSEKALGMSDQHNVWNLTSSAFLGLDINRKAW